MRNKFLIIQRIKTLPHQSLKKLLNNCTIFQQTTTTSETRRHGIPETGYPTQEREKENYQEDGKGYPTAVCQTWRTMN